MQELEHIISLILNEITNHYIQKPILSGTWFNKVIRMQLKFKSSRLICNSLSL